MQGQSINFTFAQSDYVPSTGFTVNATMDRGFSLSAAVDRAPGPPPRLQLYCAPGVGNVINSSAPLPSQASAVGSTGVPPRSLLQDSNGPDVDRQNILITHSYKTVLDLLHYNAPPQITTS